MLDRTIEDIVLNVSDTFPVLLITGPRQIGKTTLLEMCSKSEFSYVTLDDLEARTLAKEDPKLFLQTYSQPLIIEEVQHAPELFQAIKIRVDREKKNGMYWLTGSQKFLLMKGVQESLAGRVAVLDLLGLSKAEIEGRAREAEPFLPTHSWIEKARENKSNKELLDVYKMIWMGGFPRLYNESNISREVFYRSYVQTYIERDIEGILNVTDKLTFNKFLKAIAARTAQLLNYAELGRDVGIDQKTVKSWVSVLEASGIIFLLQPYYSNVSKRIIKTPKVYFSDTGLCSYLTRWDSHLSLEAGAMSGAILETYLVSEIIKSYWFRGKSPHIYFYRDTDQKEIDLIIESGDTLYPVEFKKSATPSKSASKHFRVLSKFNKTIGPGGVFCFIDRDIPLSREVTAIPVNYL